MTRGYFHLPPKKIIRLNSPKSCAEKKQFVSLALTPGIKISPLSTHFHHAITGQVWYFNGTVFIFNLRLPPAGAVRFENWLSESETSLEQSRASRVPVSRAEKRALSQAEQQSGAEASRPPSQAEPSLEPMARKSGLSGSDQICWRKIGLTVFPC